LERSFCRRGLSGYWQLTEELAMTKELRAAGIVSLAQNAQARLGKTQIQKLIYFAQRCGVPFNYKYEIYHYGPYSFELSHDLSTLNSLGVLNVKSGPSGYGYEISVGKFAQKFKLEPKYQKRIDTILNRVGRNTPAELEVKATIHFVSSVVKKDKSEVIQKVQALKPRFTEEFIESCYSDLKRMQWI
jgi:uncharacterized protein YwgA